LRLKNNAVIQKAIEAIMLIVMKTSATEGEVATIIDVVTSIGSQAHAVPGVLRTAIGITGNQGTVDATHFENLAGAAEVIPLP